MARISRHFRLGKQQPELDFVDVDLNRDVRLFVDPFAISLRTDELSKACHQTLVEFFTRVVEAIRGGRDDIAKELLSHFREPNETRFGFSRGRPQGAGIGDGQSDELQVALQQSPAVRTGFIQSLEECELLIPGISWDKISDLTTNIIRHHLAAYTLKQCELLGIPTQVAALPPAFSVENNSWVSRYFQIPVVNERPVLLVPKAFVRYRGSYDHRQYYRHFVLDFLKAEHLAAGSSLVRTLRNGTQRVYKKDIEQRFACTKDNLFRFSREHPEVLRQYRAALTEIERAGTQALVGPQEERNLALALTTSLRAIASGPEQAGTYHYLMIGLLEFMFFPHLLSPEKEREIHQGRKRIDIVMENGAVLGIFSRLADIARIPCPFIVFECKNYGREVANPELDQIAGRFAPYRGKVGFLCCRSFRNRGTFVERCRDTFRDDRGLVVPLDDELVLAYLDSISRGQRAEVDGLITAAVNEIRFN